MTPIKCSECGEILTNEMFQVNMCFKCGNIINKYLSDEEIEKQKEREKIQKIQEKNKLNKLIKEHLITSGYNFEGYIIDKYLGIVSGEVVIGTGIISEIKASFSDAFGIESNSFEKKLEEAKSLSLEKLIYKSVLLGGNAIIGVDFDYIIFANNMIGISINGTSVIIKSQE
ncbi:MAG TPA: YbjQ family protein [Clostridiales bacterium]|nr:YbjQ family protein [Clostridiales bacterium]